MRVGYTLIPPGLHTADARACGDPATRQMPRPVVAIGMVSIYSDTTEACRNNGFVLDQGGNATLIKNKSTHLLVNLV